MAAIYFKESQIINISWRWIPFIALYILLSWALYEQFIQDIDIPAVTSIVFSLCLIVFFNIIIIIMKLDTKIDDSRITYCYKPFHIKPRVIYWEDVFEFYLREYKAIMEYGGHGLQRKRKYGKSFTVSGNKGLQLILKDGKKILIGTQKPKELQLIIERLKSK